MAQPEGVTDLMRDDRGQVKNLHVVGRSGGPLLRSIQMNRTREVPVVRVEGVTRDSADSVERQTVAMIAGIDLDLDVRDRRLAEYQACRRVLPSRECVYRSIYPRFTEFIEEIVARAPRQAPRLPRGA